jgi:two-component system, LuxR family, response regulator FixJ
MEGPGTPRQRVLVIEDDAGIRELICAVLERDGYDSVPIESGEEALEAAAEELPALALLDVNLPGISGYEVCAALRRRYRDALAIVFVSGDRVESYDRVAGLLVGADDYIVKPFAPDELLGRVRAALRRVGSSEGTLSLLTPREREVLALLADGLEQTEIAERLVISSKTVASHIERILGKLGVRSRAQAVAFAYRERLVPIPA